MPEANKEEVQDDNKPNADDQVEDEGKKITSENAEDEDVKDQQDDEDVDTDKIEIPVRQNIIARQREVIKKLRSKSDENKDDDTVVIDDDDNDDELAPISKSEINKMLDSRLEPLLKNFATKADEDDLEQLFSEEPEAKKYEKRIRAYMTHEQYRGVPPAVIFHHLNYQDAESTGAKRKKVADVEARQTRSAGSARRPIKKSEEVTAEDIENMTDEEFNEYERKQRTGR